MQLYFTPLACSLASRIAIYESGLPAEFTQVNLADKTTRDGRDYRAISPKGQVPALVLDDGTLLTEGPAILQHVADSAPGAGLAPPAGSTPRSLFHMWLNYLATELHKGCFGLIFSSSAPPEAKAYALSELNHRLDHLNSSLTGRDWLADAYSVADAYLFVMLNWIPMIGLDLGRWPALASFQDRMQARPAVARAVADESALRAAA